MPRISRSIGPRLWRAADGQSIVEFAICLPVLLLLSLGVVETSNALMSQHVITKIAREGSNMISRETKLAATATALRTMDANSGSFDSTTKVIFSVLMRSQTGNNNGFLVLYQRMEFGNLSLGASRLNGSGSFNSATDYTANNPNGDTGLRVTNAPSGIAADPGGMIYVTEVYRQYDTLTPVRNIGLPIPSLLYSIAYF
jgi:Flp pilus assembly protein TadG